MKMINRNLDLTKIDNVDETMKFDKIMEYNGKWYPTDFSSQDYKIVFELNYKSDEYDYYLVQDEYGEHTIYRCKK
jgi:hypothetical protein